MKKSTVIFILMGALLGVLLGFSDIEIDLSGSKLIFAGIFMIISTFLTINIHEFGHYIFGKIAGYKLLKFIIGPLSWSFENGKFKFMIIKPQGYGGLCAMMPPREDLKLYQHALYYMGGNLFNFLSAIIAALVGLNTMGNVSLFFMCFAIVAFLLGLINSMPIMSGNNPSDGMIVWSLLLKKSSSRELLKLNQLSSQLSHGVRPRDIDVSFDSDRDIDFVGFYLLFYSYFKALDSKNQEYVDYYIGLLEKNINKIPEVMLPPIYYEICFNYSRNEDKINAEKNYVNAGKILEKDRDLNGFRVKSYYEYYINKDTQKALEYANEGLKVADKFPLKGQAIMEEELIKELIDKIS